MKCWFLVLGLAACSLTLSGPDVNRPRTKVPQCDTGKGLILLDGVLAAAAGVIAAAVAGANGGGTAIAPVVVGAAFVGAAMRGNSVVDSCRAANAEYIAAIERNQRAPIAAEEPQPQPQSQPQSQPQPLPSANVPWAESWKEVR